MGKLRALGMRMLRAGRMQDDFESELASHVAMHTEEGVRAGLDPEEARRQALIKLGGQEQVRQAYRERATLPPMESLLQDVRFALRQMRKAPGFTITAVLTLALGIGANAVIYTLVDSILLRPLPYAHARIAYDAVESDASFFPKGWVRALAEHSSSFSAISGFSSDEESNVAEGAVAERVFGAKVMANTFDTLGIHPAAGRFFRREDGIAGHDPVVVLNYGYWRHHFAENPEAIGQSLRIDGVWRKIIGVMPAGVRFPYADTQLLTPVTFKGDDPIDAWKDFDLRAFGRLKDDVTPAQAQTEVRRLHPALLPLFPSRMPDIWGSQTIVVPLLEAQIRIRWANICWM